MPFGEKKKFDEAIAEHRKAIDVDPKYADAHNNLGVALAEKNNLDEAIAEYRKAIEIDPKVALAHYNLGNALRGRRTLTRRSPNSARPSRSIPKTPPHNNLG